MQTHDFRQEAVHAATIARNHPFLWDAHFEIARALMLAGEMDIFAHLPANQDTWQPFDLAALKTDSQINLLRRKAGLPPWDAELNWPLEPPASVNSKKRIPPGERAGLDEALALLDRAARSEDERMETNYYSLVTGLRRKQAELLMKAGGGSCSRLGREQTLPAASAPL